MCIISILFVSQLGYGDLTMYGHPTSTNPNLEKMASEGLLFTQFYSASPVCSPSRAALLTGRYQTRSGIYPGVFSSDSIGGNTFVHCLLTEDSTQALTSLQRVKQIFNVIK